MIVTSEVLKQLIMLELTVPWEERIEEANERKRARNWWRSAGREAGGPSMSL